MKNRVKHLLTTFEDLFETSPLNKQHSDLVEIADKHERVLEVFARKDLFLLET